MEEENRGRESKLELILISMYVFFLALLRRRYYYLFTIRNRVFLISTHFIWKKTFKWK